MTCMTRTPPDFATPEFLVSSILPIVPMPEAAIPLPPINVLGFLADNFACGHYRMLYPMQYLAQAGMKCRIRNRIDPREVAQADIIVAQRQNAPAVEEVLRTAKAAGKIIIYEIDDNLHRVMPSSPVYGYYHEGSDACRGVERILRLATGATVSTPELADAYSRYCPNIRVVENSLDLGIRDWSSTPGDKDPNTLVIGWAGSNTHREDLEILRPAIKEILRKYDHVRLGLYMEQTMAMEILNSWDIDLFKTLLIAPRVFKDFPGGLGYFDIGLAPVKNTMFNACKSSLKFLEYGARATPCVASRVAPYARAIDNSKNGFTADSSQEWIEALSALVESDALRRDLGKNAQNLVQDKHDIAHTYRNWFEAWKSIASPASTPPSRNPAYGKTQPNDPCPCGRGAKYKKCCKGAWG